MKKRIEYTITSREGTSDRDGLDATIIEAMRLRASYKRIGEIVMQFIPDKGDARLSNVQVDSEYRGLGVGRAMVEEAESVAKNGGAERLILKSVPSAIGFYEKLGFRREIEGSDRMVKYLEEPERDQNDGD